jgi:hypothetical protein
MLAAVNVALLAGPGITAAAAADPFSGEVFWTDGTASPCTPGQAVSSRQLTARPTPCCWK